MKIDWNEFLGKTINVTMHENYGYSFDAKSDAPVYEIVFKSGVLSSAYDEGLLLETQREGEQIRIFIPHGSIKCVEIFNI
ncbi:MAG: hypothetical protein IPM56_06320 [Ignavibacteriales bacterium]|nr:MAG: hypothetical protein IPM56_06320 [Ignavibacteriales bacterium]